MTVRQLSVELNTKKKYRNDVINHLSVIDTMAPHISTMVPLQVLTDIDNSRNPILLTRERLERAATENQFMNGKITAIEVGLTDMRYHTRWLMKEND